MLILTFDGFRIPEAIGTITTSAQSWLNNIDRNQDMVDIPKYDRLVAYEFFSP